MSIAYRALGFAFLSTFIVVEVAQAGLLRTSGRGSLSREFSQAFYYVDDGNINDLGITAGEDEFFFNPSSVGSIFRGVGGGGRGIGAVPNTCIDGYTLDDVQSAIDDVESELSFLDFDTDPEAAEAREAELLDQLSQLEGSNPFPGEPCVWEFEEGENLLTFGFFSLFFDTPAVSYDVNWRITGNGVNQTLPGSVNEGGPIPTEDPEVSINRGWVTLDGLPPGGLAPGDYMLSVSARLLAQTGAFFWENGDSRDPVTIERVCDNPDDLDDQICGFNSVSRYEDEIDFELSSAPTFFQSESELLRIIPATVDPDSDGNPVPAPSTLASLLAGLLLLVRARRSRKP